MKGKNIILIIVMILIIVVIYYFESSKPDIDTSTIESDIKIEELEKEDVEEKGTITEEENKTEPDVEVQLSEEDLLRIDSKTERYHRAKEIVDPEGYINVDYINISSLIGKKIILVDFWTYSCINCQRTLPYLTTWYSTYKDDGLVIIGVHTPEFGFEEEYDNVVEATKKWGVEYPVVQDNDYQTWRAYKNRYWPRKYLIDIDGFIVYDHIGEGAYNETERRIQKLLMERNEVLGLRDVIKEEISDVEVETPEFRQIRTPELYFGYEFEKGQMGNEQGWMPDKIVDYKIPSGLVGDKFYLDGSWKNNLDSMELVSNKGKIVLKYKAKIVNLVAGSEEPQNIEVYLDGKKISDIEISHFDLYNVVDGDSYSEHQLELRIPSGVMAYTFTFG
ncbi:thioredoxin-like domain-containing protein [Nanoarchaeota archaeon]